MFWVDPEPVSWKQNEEKAVLKEPYLAPVYVSSAIF